MFSWQIPGALIPHGYLDDLRICFWCDLEKPLLQRDIDEYHTRKICQIIR